MGKLQDGPFCSVLLSGEDAVVRELRQGHAQSTEVAIALRTVARLRPGLDCSPPAPASLLLTNREQSCW